MLPIVARTIFRLQERMLGRRSFAILSELRETETWPRERLEELRLGRLRHIVASAKEHTPYWRSIMAERGIEPDDIRSLSDLRRFPLLVKATNLQGTTGLGDIEAKLNGIAGDAAVEARAVNIEKTGRR